MSGLDWEIRAYHHGRPLLASWTLRQMIRLGLAVGGLAGFLTAFALLMRWGL